MPKDLGRASRRLSRFFYIAVERALKDAGVKTNDNIKFPVLSSTCLGEMDTALGIVGDVLEYRYKMISPKAFQNAVANAPASIISIGKNIRLPVVTHCGSFLGIESAIRHAILFINGGLYDTCLVVGGDVFNENWADVLNPDQRFIFNSKLKSLSLEEGAGAILITKKDNFNTLHFEVLNSSVIHIPSNKTLTKEFLMKYNYEVDELSLVVVKTFCSHNITDMILEDNLSIPPSIVKWSNNSLANPIYEIKSLVEQGYKGNVLFIGNYLNDYGLLEIKLV